MSHPLETLAQRARHEPFFLAFLLEACAGAAGLDDAGLAATLGCTPETLLRLRLCRVPRDTAEGFREDVHLIARRFNLDPLVLARALKQGRTITRLRQVEPASEPGGFLMAARDRSETVPPEVLG